MVRYKLLFIILFFFISVISIQATKLTDVDLETFNIYKTSSFIDSTLVYVVEGSSFFLKGETSPPPIPNEFSPNYILAEVTRHFNPHDTVFIKLIQDVADSTVFKSEIITIVEEGNSNSQLRHIGVRYNSGETITISYGGFSDTLVVAIAQPPSMLNNLRFFSDHSFNNLLSGTVPIETTLFIKANALESNEYTRDTFSLVVKSSSDSIVITMTETAKDNGVFQGSVKLKHFSNEKLRYIEAVNGDTITIYPLDTAVTSWTDTNPVLYVNPGQSPDEFHNISFKTSGSYETVKTDAVMENQLLYVKLYAEDRNIFTQDTTVIIIKNDDTGDSIKKVVFETASGIYQTTFQLGSYTNKTSQVLGVDFGHTISVFPKYSPALEDNIQVTVPKLPLFIDNLRIFFDASYNSIISDTIPPGQTLYIEANGEDGNPIAIDTVAISVSNNNDTIIINLTETARNTGKYRGTVEIGNFNDTGLRKIAGFPGDEITVKLHSILTHGSVNAEKSFNIQGPTEPGKVINLELKTNASYTTTEYDSLVPNRQLFIELIAEDRNIHTSDNARVIVKNNRNNDSVTVLLQEVSSGVFRGPVQLSAYTSEETGKLEANYGDSITLHYIHYPADSVTYYLTVQKPPVYINNLRYMSSGYSSSLAGDSVLPRSTLFVEANGLDANPLTADIFKIVVETENDSIYLELIETGNNTGKYRGSFRLSNYTAEKYSVIKADTLGDNVRIGYYLYDNAGNITSIKYTDTVYIELGISPEKIYNLNVFRPNGDRAVEILPNEQIRVEVAAADLNPLSPDKTQVIVKNTSNNNDTIILDLVETGNASGIFQGSFRTVRKWTNQTLSEIGVSYNDVLVIYSKTSPEIRDTSIVTVPKQPQNIHSITFMNPGFSSELSDYTRPGVEIGIRMLAEDKNPIYRDTVNITVKDAYGDTITLELVETSVNSGEFRNTVFLDNFTYDNLRRIKAFIMGDTVVAIHPESQTADTIFIQTTISPMHVRKVNFKSDGSYLYDKAVDYTDNDVVYIEVVATDLNPYVADELPVTAFSYSSETIPANPSDIITVTLRETGINTSRFRGSFLITELTNDTLDELRVNFGDTIRVEVRGDSITGDTHLEASMTIPQGPLTKNDLLFTTSNYQNRWPSFTQVTYGDRLYIKFTGTDANPLTVDTVAVILYTLDHPAVDTASYMFRLELTETGRHTGIFTGSVLLDSIKVQGQNRMRMRQNTFIVMNTEDTFPGHYDTSLVNNAQDTVQTATSRPPTIFESLDIKTNSSFNQNKLSPIMWDQYLYIQAEADRNTSSNLVVDTIAFQIWSDYEILRDTPAWNQTFELVETAIHSGVYRHSMIEVRNADDISILSPRRLEVEKGDWVTIILLNPNVDTDPMSVIQNEGWSIAQKREFSGKYASPRGRRFVEKFGFVEDLADRYGSMILQREVAYEIPPDRLREINVYRNSSYSIASRIVQFVSFEPGYNRFYFDIDAFELDGDIFDTRPYSNHMLQDTLPVYIEVRDGTTNQIKDSNTIVVLETQPRSNKFRNWVSSPFHQESLTLVRPVDLVNPQSQIWADRGDIIHIHGRVVDDSAPIALQVATFKQPEEIRSVNFYTSSSYNQELAGINLIMEDFMYVQAVGRNSARILIDTMVVKIIRESFDDPTADTDYITILLTETAVGSEIYRVADPEPMPRIYYFTDNNANYLYATARDTITVVPYYGRYRDTPPPEVIPTDATRIGIPQSPTHIFVFNVFTDPGYLAAIPPDGVIALDGTMYIEARGDYGNNVIRDTTLVIVENLTTGERIRKILRETGARTGRYRGSVRLTPTTNDTLDELGVSLGDELRLRIFGDQFANDPDYRIGGEVQFCTVTIPSGYPRIVNVTENTPPSTINNINFMNPGFNQRIRQQSGLVRNRSTIHIEVNGLDGNPQLADYIYVKLFSLSPDQEFQTIPPYLESPSLQTIKTLPPNLAPPADSTTITYGLDDLVPFRNGDLRLQLYETGRNTGKFQGVAHLRDYNDTHQKFLSARPGDTLYAMVRCPEDSSIIYIDQINVAQFEVLEYITFLNFRTPDYQEDWPHFATFGDNLYVMLFGDIGSPLLVDEVDVHVYNVRDGNVHDSITITLIETGESTGEYRGRVNLGRSPTDVTRRDARPQILQIDDGDELYIKWADAVDADSPLSRRTASDSIIIEGELQPIPPDEILTVRITTDNTYIHAVDTMTHTILPTDYVWVEVIGTDKSEWTIDPTVVVAYNPTYGESIYVTLWESSRTSGEFQGYFKLDKVTNQTLGTLKASLGETIVVWSDIAPDTEEQWTTRWQVRTVENRPPKYVNSITIMNSSYSDYHVGAALPLSRLHVQLDGEDGEPIWRDTTIVYVSSNRDTTGIKLELTETGVNTGKYRGYFELQTYTDEFLKLINAFEYGDVVVVSETVPGVYTESQSFPFQGWEWNQTDEVWEYKEPDRYPPEAPQYRYDKITVSLPKSPEKIVSVRIKDSSNYMFDRVGDVSLTDMLYIEVVAQDKNPLSADTTMVTVVAHDQPDPFKRGLLDRINVVLRESGPNTSRFRGTAKITDLTNDTLDELGVDFGDTITVFSTIDTSVQVSIKVGVLVPPTTMNRLAFMNSSYSAPRFRYQQVQYGDVLHIQFTGHDASPHTRDTVAVLLTSLGGETTAEGTGQNQLRVTLHETGLHTGVFRNSVTLAQTKVEFDGQYRLHTLLNGFILLEPYDKGKYISGGENLEYNHPDLVQDRVQTATLQTPAHIFDLYLMKPGWNRKKLSPIKWGEPLLIEAEADKHTSSNLLRDTVAVTIISRTEDKFDEENSTFDLLETGIHTGIFRATLQVNHIDDVGGFFHPEMIEVRHGDTVYFKSTDPVGRDLIWHVADYISPPRIKTLHLFRDSGRSNRVSDYFVSYEPAYRNLYFSAEAWPLPGHPDYDTWPYANVKLPDTFTLVLKTQSPTYISDPEVRVEMVETGDNTRIFTNRFEVPSVNESEIGEMFVRAKRGDTLFVYADVTGTYPGDTQPMILKVQEFKQPEDILDLKFYTNSSYSQQLNQLNLNIEDRLYIQAVGRRSASILRDTITVVLQSTSSLTAQTDTQIEVMLTETAVGSEIYRVTSPEPLPQLFYPPTRPASNYLWARTGDKIELFYKDERNDTIIGPADVTWVAQPQTPERTYAINVFTDGGYNNSTLNREVARESTLYIEVRGGIGNNILRDTTLVALHNVSNDDTIYIELLETAAASGIYRGSANLGLVSNITLRTLGVNFGDEIVISSLAEIPADEVSLDVAINRNPKIVNAIRFYNSSFNQLLSEHLRSRVLNQTKLYVELNGEDATPLVRDLTTEDFISIYSFPPNYDFSYDRQKRNLMVFDKYNTSDSFTIDSTEARNRSVGHIPLRLRETGLNTGKYRGEVNLSTVNDTYKVLLKADTAFTIVVWCEKEDRIYYDTAWVADFEEPHYITTMRFMNSNYTSELDREVTFDETLYIEMFGDFASPLLRDEPEIKVVIHRNSENKVDTYVKNLKETSNTSGFYRGRFVLSERITNQEHYPPIYRVSDGDTIIVHWKKNPNAETAFVTVASRIPRPPNNISHLEIYKTSQFISPYEKNKLTRNITLYIQALEADTFSNPVIVDTMSVYLHNPSFTEGGETITVILTETGVNSRRFRGTAELTETQTNETQNKIRATFGDTIILTPYVVGSDTYYENSEIEYVVYNLLNLQPPVYVNSLRFMESNWSRTLQYSPIPGDRLYIQLDGLDSNPNYVDKFDIKIHSFFEQDGEIKSRADTFMLELTETGLHTGIYRAMVDIDRVTFRTHTPPKIRASENDFISISYIDNRNVLHHDTLRIRDSLEVVDVQDLGFVEVGTDTIKDDREFDYGLIELEATAPGISVRTVDYVKLQISKKDKNTGTISHFKDLMLNQTSRTSIYFRNKLNLVSQYTIHPDPSLPLEYKINRGDTLIVKWVPPVEAPYWADTIVLERKIGEFKQPDTVSVRVFKKLSDNSLEPIEKFNNIINQNDIIVIEAVETQQSISNRYVFDTVGVDVVIKYQHISKNSPSFNSLNSNSNNSFNNSNNFSKNISNSPAVYDNIQSFVLTETTRKSRVYRKEILVTNDLSIESKYDKLYGVAPEAEVIFMIQSGIDLPIGEPATKLIGGRFLAQNPQNFGPYPNPYNAVTSNVRYITFAGMLEGSNVKIYDVQGRLVATLYEKESQIINGYDWDLRNTNGKSVASGVYIFVMQTINGNTKVGKFSIIR